MAKRDKNVETQAEEKVSKSNKTEKNLKNNKNQKGKKAKKQDAPKANIAKESVAELKRVTWPSFKEVVKNTLVVLGIVIACTAALFLIDRVLSWLYQLMISGTVTNWF